MSPDFQYRFGIPLVERGLVPEPLVRFGMRRLIASQLARREAAAAAQGGRDSALRQMVEELKTRPVALVPEKANEQHYEVPASFFYEVLGRHLKYSCCYWDEDTADLSSAEKRMLDITIDRAQIADGMNVLELGCGWGSATLAVADRFSACRITAVSNSRLQKESIDRMSGERGLDNVEVITADMNEFDIDRTFDRVISIEMFEHMHNYEELLSRIARWLAPDGKLFVHIFSHRSHAYFFETDGAENWMGRYFFTGGLMPSDDLLLHFKDSLVVDDQWRESGIHYERTANAWAEKMDQNRERVMSILRNHYGSREGALWYERWKMFFWACAETFGYNNGDEWGVSHYLFSKPSR